MLKRVLLVASLTLATASLSDDAAAQATQAKSEGEGEVKKIDTDAGKITIKHGPIESLDMPGMTMVFRVSDPPLLKKAKVGETVTFTLLRENGVMSVTALDPKK